MNSEEHRKIVTDLYRRVSNVDDMTLQELIYSYILPHTWEVYHPRIIDVIEISVNKILDVLFKSEISVKVGWDDTINTISIDVIWLNDIDRGYLYKSVKKLICNKMRRIKIDRII